MTSILAASSCFGKTNNGYELSGVSTLKDMNNNSETPSVSGMIRPLVDIADRKLLHVGVVLGPIPNLFKWLQNELNRVEKALQNSLVMINNRSNQSQTLVELALTKEEQNMEIVLINEQYYFEVVRSFRVQQKSANHDHYSVGTPPTSGSSGSDLKTDFGEKPKAWFCKEIEERISTIRPAQTWLNGKELFCCLLCNHFSFYSNHLMLHMMFDCPKKPHSQQNLSGDNGSRSTNNGQQQQQQQQHPIESLTKAKMLTNQIMVDFNQNHHPNNSKNQKQIRSFDIMSLLNNGKNEDKDDEEVDVETLDSNEETIQPTLKVLNHNVHPLKQNTKRQTDSKLQHHQQHDLYHQTILVGPNQSKECPPPPLQSSSSMKKFNGNRKYSNKCGKISKSFNSPPSSGSNNNKSAFKKFRNNKNIKTSNKLNPQQQLFISNQANLTNFHNKFSAPPTHTNGAATNPLFSFANLFRSSNQSGSNQNRISNLSSPNSSTESIPLISQLYPLISSNTNSHNHLVTNGQLSQNKLLAISPTGAQQQPSTSNLFENNTSNNITVSTMDQSSSIKTIGNISLESNSPTLSESSGSLISLPNSPAYTASANYSTNNNHFDDNNINKSNDEKIFHDSEPSSTIQLLPQSAQSTMANNPLFNLPPYFMPPTSTAASNPLITSLYLLSPSLTALSYQASNVCAYCNTAFRMTSDLVYHMRSHHKRTKSNDDQVNKKRRDDQLRCHICNETFRERHHLTRHMTSHQ